VLEAYGADGVLFVQRRVGTSSFDAALQGIFEPAEVHYAHLRNAEAGCFIARIDRVQTLSRSRREQAESPMDTAHALP
jgi:hypothetical protein